MSDEARPIELEPDDDPEIERLLDAASDHREAGRVLLVSRRIAGPGTGAHPEAIATVAARVLWRDAGYPGVERFWPLPSERVAPVLTALLARDLAYGAPAMDEALAAQLAQRFVALFPEGAVFLTNGELAQNHAARGSGAGWTPVTGATFDTGVVAVGGGRVALLWFEDED